MKPIENIKLFVWKLLFFTTRCFLLLIPKKKGLVLFTSWYGLKYIDNTKYVYEYFLYNTDYKPVWMTRNDDIFKTLSCENKPVAKFNSFKGKMLQIRAEAVFSTIQFADYSKWFVHDCFFIDLGHGHPIKDSGLITRSEYAVKYSSLLEKKVNYYAIVASERSKQRYDVVGVDKSHIFVSDFARNDVFYDETLRKGKNKEVFDFVKGRKTIVYMPTHRSDGTIKMNMEEILPLDELQSFCERNNCVFIIKKHFYHRKEKENLSIYPNLMDITNIDSIDPQVLLYQADVLISDYSACYVDYMLLKRPIVFYHYDIDYFEKKERNLNTNFNEENIAPIAYNKTDLIEILSKAIGGIDELLEKRIKFSNEYYFDNMGAQLGREKVRKIVDTLFSK